MLFFERGDTEDFKAAKNKLFASNAKQIDNHTLMLDMLHSYMSVMCSYRCRGVFKKGVLVWLLSPIRWPISSLSRLISFFCMLGIALD